MMRSFYSLLNSIAHENIKLYKAGMEKVNNTNKMEGNISRRIKREQKK